MSCYMSKEDKTPEQIIEERKQELIEAWKRTEEVTGIEKYINNRLDECFGQGNHKTANEIADELREVLVKNEIHITSLSDAILVYLAELLKL